MPGLLSGVGSGIKGLFSGLRDPQTQYALAAARAYADGDYNSAARIQSAAHDYGLDRDKLEAAKRSREELINAARAVIKTPEEWAEFQANPEKWGEERLGNRYGFQEVTAGNTAFWGNPDLEGSTARIAPKVHEVGPDLVMSDPGGLLGGGAPRGPAPAPADVPGEPDEMQEVWDFVASLGAGAPEPERSGDSDIARTIYTGKSEMERYAEQFGPRGSPEWKSAIQDYRLTGAGPTAYIYRDKLQDQSLTQSDVNNARTNRTSADNNVRTTTTSADNSRRSNLTSRDNASLAAQTRLALRGKKVDGVAVSPNEEIAQFPDGSIRVARRGQWVPTGERWR